MLEAKVMVVLITSSPGPIPSAASAMWRAAVQELTASDAGAPVNWPEVLLELPHTRPRGQPIGAYSLDHRVDLLGAYVGGREG